MKNKISIEKMKIEDIDFILEIEKSQNVKILTKSMLENDINNSISMYYVAKLDNIIVGYIAALYLTDHIDIEAVVVDKKYTRQHIASLLIEYLITLARSYRVEKIFLEVRVSNSEAILLYEKYHFKNISLRKKYYDNKEDACVYELVL